MADLRWPRGLMAAAALLFCLMLIAGTLAAAGVNIWPPKSGDLLWRIVLVSQGVNGLGNTITGLGVVLLVGLAARQPALLLVGGWLATACFTAVFLALLMLALDYLQFRGQLLPEAVSAWDLAITGSLLLGGYALVVLGALGWTGVRASRPGGRAARRADDSPAKGMMVSGGR